uniref:Uncharacterized protein n=1 Tax=Populus trichocarpa TaxID=3694 RepID=A0A2K1ZTC9_POPTR
MPDPNAHTRPKSHESDIKLDLSVIGLGTTLNPSNLGMGTTPDPNSLGLVTTPDSKPGVWVWNHARLLDPGAGLAWLPDPGVGFGEPGVWVWNHARLLDPSIQAPGSETMLGCQT